MNIHELASRFLYLKTQKEEQRRVIDYDMRNKLKKLEGDNHNVEGKLRVLDFKDKIKLAEEDYLQISAELQEVVEELKPYLIELGATRLDPLITHVQEKTYFDVWLDENKDVQCPGLYSKN